MSADPVQDYLDSNETAPHPLDVPAPSTAGTTGPLSSDPVQAYLDSNEKAPHPLADSDSHKDSPKENERRDKQTVLGAAQAAGSGFNAGVADLAGLPVDTARNAIELAKAGAGTLYGAATSSNVVPTGETMSRDGQSTRTPGGLYHFIAPDGSEHFSKHPPPAGSKPALSPRAGTIPSFLQPNEQPDVLSSGWIKDQSRNLLGVGSVDPLEDTTANDYLHSAGEAIPGVLAGARGTAGAARAATAGAALGAVNQASADAGLSPGAQQAVNILAGHGISRATGAHATVTASAEAAPENYANETKAAPKPEAPGSASVAERAAILNAVGFDSARTSALTNDGPAGMSEYQTSRDPTTPQGLAARALFDNERQTLNAHADSIIQDTGATHPGLDGASLDAKGEIILKPFEELQDHFDAQRKAAYDAADEKAGSTGIYLKGFGDVLNDRSRLTNSDRHGLQGGLQAYLEKNDMLSKDGSISGTAAQAETLRRYLNENWTPSNSKYVGALKDALDDDVTKQAGSDIYKNARAIVKQQKDTLENPNGIGNLLDSSGPSGINRKVPIGKVADTIASMPTAQLKHVIRTLDGMPPELQESAQAAKAELQGHLAARLQEAGNRTAESWSHKPVNQFMDANSAKLPIVFGADNPALTKMQNLRAAGNILRVDRSYPGAAIQANIIRSKILPYAATIAGGSLGSGVGHFIGGPAGAWAGGGVGTAIGSGIAAKIGSKAAAKAVQKRVQPLE